MKKAFLLLALMIIGFLNLYSQNDNSDSDIISQNELFAIQYSKKSASKAMLMSAVFPGAGQFYVSPRNFTTYLFPLIEVGLWYGYFKFNKEGNNLVSDYEKFADRHYTRDHQYQVQKDLILQNTGDIYTPGMQPGYDDETDQEHWLDEWGNGAHFNLDYENTQHYYEDIGKYNQYLFGWDDWYDIYATLEGGIYTNPRWEFDNGSEWKVRPIQPQIISLPTKILIIESVENTAVFEPNISVCAAMLKLLTTKQLTAVSVWF